MTVPRVGVGHPAKRLRTLRRMLDWRVDKIRRLELCNPKDIKAIGGMWSELKAIEWALQQLEPRQEFITDRDDDDVSIPA